VCDLALIAQQAAEEREKGRTVHAGRRSAFSKAIICGASRLATNEARLQAGEGRDVSETATSKCLLA
jgi:hypothetical protein